MIKVIKGNIFQQDVEALVNPVNCAGVMGAGLAKQFKIRYPEYFYAYQYECQDFLMSLGKVSVYRQQDHENPKWLISFPTKHHWEDNSEIYSIDLGLNSLLDKVVNLKIKSIAIPALGCGLGGLSWMSVLALMKFKLEPYDDLQTVILKPR